MGRGGAGSGGCARGRVDGVGGSRRRRLPLTPRAGCGTSRRARTVGENPMGAHRFAPFTRWSGARRLHP